MISNRIPRTWEPKPADPCVEPIPTCRLFRLASIHRNVEPVVVTGVPHCILDTTEPRLDGKACIAVGIAV